MKDTLGILESIGVNISVTKMRVLQSVLRVGGSSSGATFDRIYDEVGKAKGRRPRRAWVYRCLEELNEEGFISFDKLKRPRVYSATRMTILAGLEHARKNCLAVIEAELSTVGEKMRLLENTSPGAMSAYVYEAATGTGKQHPTGIVKGVDNVRRLIRTEFLDCSSPGDIMRLTHRMDNLVGTDEKMSIIDTEIVSTIMRGIQLRVLLIPSAMAPDMSSMSQNVSGKENLLMEALKSRRFVIRAYTKDIQTYRLLSLNNDKLMMILTHSYRPDTVVLFRREEHPVLVDKAIEAFDRLYNESIDALQLFQAALRKST